MLTTNDPVYDCAIIGAGPGGIQAALHLARFNRNVIVLDRGGGRTRHAANIVNYLGLKQISGRELINIGLDQVRAFGVRTEHATVISLIVDQDFELRSQELTIRARYVIASSGATEILPHAKNLGRFFPDRIYTCVACDGHHTQDTKLVILGNSEESVRLAMGMRSMYTDDVTLILSDYALPIPVAELLVEDGISHLIGAAVAFLGEAQLEGVQLDNGTKVACETVMVSLGHTLNDAYLAALPLDRTPVGRKILTGESCETSVRGLYALGPLRTGHAQAIIAAGQGAVAAFDINQQLLEL